MKKLVTFFALIACAGSKSQTSFFLGTGYSTKNAPLSELAVKHNVKDYYAKVGYLNHLSNVRGLGAVMHGYLGFDMQLKEDVTISPGVGYYYHVVSNDFRSLNTSGVAVTTTLVKDRGRKPSRYLSFTLADNVFFVTVGFYESLRRKRSVCDPF